MAVTMVGFKSLAELHEEYETETDMAERAKALRRLGWKVKGNDWTHPEIPDLQQASMIAAERITALYFPAEDPA